MSCAAVPLYSTVPATVWLVFQLLLVPARVMVPLVLLMTPVRRLPARVMLPLELSTLPASTLFAVKSVLLTKALATLTVSPRAFTFLVPPVSVRLLYSSLMTTAPSAAALYLTVPFSVLLAAVHSLPVVTYARFSVTPESSVRVPVTPKVAAETVLVLPEVLSCRLVYLLSTTS